MPAKARATSREYSLTSRSIRYVVYATWYTVTEFDAGDEFWQLIFASQPQPGLLRLLDNLEDHQLHGLHGQTT